MANSKKETQTPAETPKVVPTVTKASGPVNGGGGNKTELTAAAEKSGPINNGGGN
jgi:hypothetical protein